MDRLCRRNRWYPSWQSFLALESPALAVEHIEAARNDHQPTGEGPAVRNVAEHQKADDDHGDDLGVDEGREDRGRGASVGLGQHEVTDGAETGGKPEKPP